MRAIAGAHRISVVLYYGDGVIILEARDDFMATLMNVIAPPTL
jgi:hypothetical protein